VVVSWGIVVGGFRFGVWGSGVSIVERPRDTLKGPLPESQGQNMASTVLQGYLAHKKQPPSLGPP